VNKIYTVYIMANERNTVLYTGITSSLRKRVFEHKEKIIKGFTNKYNVSKLVYYELFSDALTAITREKQIKAGSRDKKLVLVNGFNPRWRDLYEEL